MEECLAIMEDLDLLLYGEETGSLRSASLREGGRGGLRSAVLRGAGDAPRVARLPEGASALNVERERGGSGAASNEVRLIWLS